MPPIRRMYQTVAYTPAERTQPHLAKNIQWLGEGYYFWYHKEDAFMWGRTQYQKKGMEFDIYTADIDFSDIFDTAFNQEHYDQWCAMIEDLHAKQLKLRNKNLTLEELNEFFFNFLRPRVAGICFEDIPGKGEWLIDEYSYRKRIQLVSYKLEIISNFALFYNSC